nr:MAG TPA: hypothetical protein [Caudoviricetes sp.]
MDYSIAPLLLLNSNRFFFDYKLIITKYREESK